MAASSKVTTDHDEIRRWAEARSAAPSTVTRTRSSKDIGIIRLDFPGFSGEGALEPITWDEFFTKFDDEGLAFVYQDKTAAGRTSSFNRFVKRDTVLMPKRGAAKRASGKRAAAKRGGATRGAAKRTGQKRAATKRTATKRTAAKRPAEKRTATKTAAKRGAATKRTAAKRRRPGAPRSARRNARPPAGEHSARQHQALGSRAISPARSS